MHVNIIHSNERTYATFTNRTAEARATIQAPDYEHYSGDYAITPEKQTQTLNTENKYVAHDIVIDPIPDNYIDVSDTTATPADVKRSKAFYTADGELTQGELREYIGNYEITPSNTVQTLQTQNRYCDSDIIINAIPSEYTDVTDTTATPADVLSSKMFHKSDGELVAGNIPTYSGMQTVTPSENANTLATDRKFIIGNIVVNPIPSNYTEFESGIWEPDSDVERGSVSFANTHSSLPKMIVLQDITQSTSSNNSGLIFTFIGYEQATGYPLYLTNPRYALLTFTTKNNTGGIVTGLANCTHPATDSGDSSSEYIRYWVSESGFNPATNTAERYFRANRSYAWFAVW